MATFLTSLPDPAYLLELRSTRMAALELGLLAVSGGVVGAFVVLRRLAFFSHAVGTATFPGLVVAAAVDFNARVAALAVAVAYALGTERAGRSGRDPGGAATGLMLVAALGTGTILASDVFESGAGVDRLLFGTAVALNGTDLAVAGAAAALSLAAAVLLGRTWAAIAFDPSAAPALGVPARRVEGALLLLVAVTAVAALPAVGSLLVTSLFVVPAAVARLFAGSVASLVALSVAVAVAQGLLGLYVSLWLDVPPGPAIAVLGAATYALASLLRSLPFPARRTRAEVAA
ncbi:MAG: metal ABC transporter permease [Thermoleophilaceae bacterium]